MSNMEGGSVAKAFHTYRMDFDGSPYVNISYVLSFLNSVPGQGAFPHKARDEWYLSVKLEIPPELFERFNSMDGFRIYKL